jgi:hypothetical protein
MRVGDTFAYANGRCRLMLDSYPLAGSSFTRCTFSVEPSFLQPELLLHRSSIPLALRFYRIYRHKNATDLVMAWREISPLR